MTHKQAFNNITAVAKGWVNDVLFDTESTEKDYITALAYIVSMVESYDDAIEE